MAVIRKYEELCEIVRQLGGIKIKFDFFKCRFRDFSKRQVRGHTKKKSSGHTLTWSVDQLIKTVRPKMTSKAKTYYLHVFLRFRRWQALFNAKRKEKNFGTY